MSSVVELDNQLDCYEVVQFVITEVIRSFDNKLEENELSTLEIPTAVALAMAKMEAVVKLATMQYDGISSADNPFERMDPDAEPVPTIVDTWARGTGSDCKSINFWIHFLTSFLNR